MKGTSTVTQATLKATAERGIAPSRAGIDLRQAAILVCAIAVSTAALAYVAQRLLPIAGGYLGHDHRYFLPYLLAGAAWIEQNGWLAVPHFTPDFCGGMPWLANPQSMFYSVPQILTVWLADPVAATKWSLLIFATMGGAATAMLLRRCFALSWHAAALGFVLFQLNGFLIFRVGIGHLTYHVYGLVPVLCLCVLIASGADGSRSRAAALAKCVVAALVGAGLIAIMVYGGALNYIIPAALSAAAIILIHQAGSGLRPAPWLMLAGACVWSVPLSALKLVPAFVFASGYPRGYLPRHLFDDSLRLADTLWRALFAPATQPFVTAMNHAPESVLGLHEFEFGVSLVPLFLIPAGLVVAYRQRQAPRHPLAWIGLAAIVAIPILGTFGNAAWGRFLLHVPIVNNNTVLVRWWSIYILVLIVLAAQAFDRVAPRTWARDGMFAACILIAVVQSTLRDFSFYTTSVVFPLYDSAPVTSAVRDVVVNREALPSISRIGLPSDIAPPPPGIATMRDNDGLLTGVSALPCYEPLFGYAHEMFPARGLQSGPLNHAAAGLVNLADPRCYLTPGANACGPGDQFRAVDDGEVREFVSHRPLDWQQPAWQAAAGAATVASLGLSAVVLAGFGAFQLLRKVARSAVTKAR